MAQQVPAKKSETSSGHAGAERYGWSARRCRGGESSSLRLRQL